MEFFTGAVLLGAGATAGTDLWALVRRQCFGVAPPDYALVGRWFGHMPRGRFVHTAITAAPPVRGEAVLGWSAHYLIGMVFAALLLGLCGVQWLHVPTLAPALAVGIATVAAPYLLLQPGMGAGIAARRTPRPWTARGHSLVMHVMFGLGLYATAWLTQGLWLR